MQALKNHPKLSIITINFNNRSGLEKTIQSVVRQTFTDFEYIVIDGGSTDGSVEVIQEYENRIDYWVSEPDKGIYNAMNKGIKEATGDYIFFLNSGDRFLHNEVLKIVASELEANHSLDFVIGQSIRFSIKTGRLYLAKYNNVNFDPFFFLRKTIHHQALFASRKMFDRIGGFNEALKIKSDHEWLIKAFLGDKATYRIIEVGITICAHEGLSNSLGSTIGKKERMLLANKYFGARHSTLLNQYYKNRFLRRTIIWFSSFSRFRKIINRVLLKK